MEKAMTDEGTSESGVQLLARLEVHHSLGNIEPQLFPQDCHPVQGDVVELYGTEGTGKTETLYHLVARCILPAASGGLEVEVMFVDTDYNFDCLRLVAVLERRLSCGTDGEGGEEAVRGCLQRLHVLHCSSSIQLLLTLHSVEDILCRRPALGLLILDSISAFYWSDRSGGGESVALQERNLRRCAQFLKKLLQEHRMVIFASTHAIMRGPAPESLPCRQGPDFSKAYLCRAWQQLVSHRLLFSRTDAPKDGKRVFSVISSSSRTSSVKRCSFCITDEGVQFL